MTTGQATTVIVCGTSPLTLALCANLVRQRLDRNYYCPPGSPPPPALTIVAGNAEEYRLDHEFHQQQLGLPPTADWLDAVSAEPSMPALTPLITTAGDGENYSAAVIIVTNPDLPTTDATLGTRLAARFPTLPVFVWDPKVPENSDVDAPPVVGALRTFRLAMDTTVDRPLDAFERAARLIHERYAAQARENGRHDDATKPWDELNDLYKHQNRRQVRNAFKIVEEKGGHSWNTFSALPDPPAAVEDTDTDDVERALQRLRAIGFDRDAAMAMARAEHQDWLNCLIDEGWKRSDPDEKRDDVKKTRPDLVEWDNVEKDRKELANALNSLAETLYTLRQLGYRSRPVWQHFHRIGEVTAVRRDRAWTWTTESGNAMHAAAGDWEVSDGDRPSWSVRDDIFRSTYEHIDGNRWRRTGFVRARPARDGETIQSLEGRTVAPLQGWVVKGTHGEEWVVPADVFARHYEPVDVSATTTE